MDLLLDLMLRGLAITYMITPLDYKCIAILMLNPRGIIGGGVLFWTALVLCSLSKELGHEVDIESPFGSVLTRTPPIGGWWRRSNRRLKTSAADGSSRSQGLAL